MTCQEELARDGWKKQAGYDEPRLSELVGMYEEIGFEVRLEPFRPEEESGCNECMKADSHRYKTIYTKKRG
jgi:hypothetical protein